MTCECGRPAVARGLCHACYERKRRRGEDLPPWQRPERQPCADEDCDRPSSARGLCALHYQRAMRGAKPRKIRNPQEPRQCEAGGCNLPHRARGLCNMHYKRYQRGLVPRRRRGPKPRPTAGVKPRKPSKPTGRERPLITGRLSPSPFPDAPPKRALMYRPDGFIPGSTKVASGWVNNLGRSADHAMRVHTRSGCIRLDSVHYLSVGVWDHPTEGVYFVHPISTKRVGVTFCEICRVREEVAA